MTANTRKTLSIGVVGVMVGYCCWPYVFGSGSGSVAQPVVAPAAISASQLTPAIDPAPARDPFRIAPRAQVGVEVSTTNRREDAQAEIEADTATETKNDSDQDTIESLGALALNATFVRGDQRVALINGRVYSPGEPLADAGSFKSPFVVSEIFADRVVLERKGQTTEISYPDLHSTSPTAVRKPATPPSARTHAATKRPANDRGRSLPSKPLKVPSPEGPQRP
jgi:hypothetical protein